MQEYCAESTAVDAPWMLASLAASITRSISTSSSHPYKIFSRTVPENKRGSCWTNPSLDRSHFMLKSSTKLPSIVLKYTRRTRLKMHHWSLAVKSIKTHAAFLKISTYHGPRKCLIESLYQWYGSAFATSGVADQRQGLSASDADVQAFQDLKGEKIKKDDFRHKCSHLFDWIFR